MIIDVPEEDNCVSDNDNPYTTQPSRIHFKSNKKRSWEDSLEAFQPGSESEHSNDTTKINEEPEIGKDNKTHVESLEISSVGKKLKMMGDFEVDFIDSEDDIFEQSVENVVRGNREGEKVSMQPVDITDVILDDADFADLVIPSKRHLKKIKSKPTVDADKVDQIKLELVRQQESRYRVDEKTLAELSADQKQALSHALGGKNIFITGNAGTGKTKVGKKIIELLTEKHQGDVWNQIHVLAPTGTAASNIGGTTIHKFLGIGIKKMSKEDMFKSKSADWMVRTRCEQTRVLFIDEISMVSGEFFDTMDYFLRRMRCRLNEPFGGIQIIVCGDLCQLPPIQQFQDPQFEGDEINLYGPPQFRQQNNPVSYVIDSQAWRECRFEVIYLETQFRQSTDTRFTDVLNDIRFGSLSIQNEKILRECYNRKFDSSITPTRLYSRKKDVKNQNENKLRELPGRESTYNAKDSYPHGKRVEFEDALNKNCIALPVLRLKVSAVVILLRNLDVEGGLVNGSVGIVKDFISELVELSEKEKKEIVTKNPKAAELRYRTLKFILVHFYGCNRDVKIGVEEWEIMGAGGMCIAKRVQYPLDLAWAISIHKSQGMTIDFLETTFDGAFEYGQIYVALSRGRTLEGLRITGTWNPRKVIKAHPQIVDYYISLSRESLRKKLEQERKFERMEKISNELLK